MNFTGGTPHIDARNSIFNYAQRDQINYINFPLEPGSRKQNDIVYF
jgi:hypothetical protein